MKTELCSGCGGRIGLDCFNPRECQEITRNLAYVALAQCNQYGGSPDEILDLLNEKDDKIDFLEKCNKSKVVLYQLKNTVADFKSYKVYRSEERARNLSRFLNRRWNTGSVYAIWIVVELKCI